MVLSVDNQVEDGITTMTHNYMIAEHINVKPVSQNSLAVYA